MPRLLNDYRCNHCGTVHELFQDTAATEVKCTQCGGSAKRVIRAPRVYLDPISGDFPGATEKWANNRTKHMKKERRDSAYCPVEGTIIRDNP